MTASEQLLSAWRLAVDHILAMSAAELGLNLALSLAIVALGALAGFVVGRMVRFGARRLPGPSNADKAVRTQRISRFCSGLVRWLSAGAVILLVAGVWGVDILALARAGVGEVLVAAILRLALLALITAAAFEAAGYVIGQLLGRLASDDAHPRRQAQLNTLGPLLIGVVQTAILIVALLMALGELGVKIGPLLAGAGVVGIAVGFGAQTLVKDLLTGVFLIVEDIVSVGDIVRIGDSGGLVEQMTLRTIRLRDFDGALHVFPYGEAQVVHNLTKTFSYYVFDLQVSYSSDIDLALKLMKQVGLEMQGDPDFAEKILEPIEVVGVDSLADSGVVLKARIKTQPIQQWSVGREYNRRIKLAFDDAGIEIPFPHMKVVLPERQLHELVRH